MQCHRFQFLWLAVYVNDIPSRRVEMPDYRPAMMVRSLIYLHHESRAPPCKKSSYASELMTSVNQEISCIRMGSGPALFGLARFYCTIIIKT